MFVYVFFRIMEKKNHCQMEVLNINIFNLEMLDSWKLWKNLTHRFLTLLCSAARKSCRPSSV